MTRTALAAAVLLLGVAACGSDGSVTTTTSRVTTTTTGSAVTDLLDSFDHRQITVSGETWTVAVADTLAARSQGLMGVTALGDLDGMLFVFSDDTDSGFWMRNTLIPLDIAFFAADGTLVDLLTMNPCPGDPCPVYHPRGSYRYALETAVGRWDAIEVPVLEWE